MNETRNDTLRRGDIPVNGIPLRVAASGSGGCRSAPPTLPSATYIRVLSGYYRWRTLGAYNDKRCF